MGAMMSSGKDRTSSVPGDGARLAIRLVGTGEVTAAVETGSEISVDGVTLLGDVSWDARAEGEGRVKGVNERR